MQYTTVEMTKNEDTQKEMRLARQRSKTMCNKCVISARKYEAAAAAQADKKSENKSQKRQQKILDQGH